MPHTPVSAAAAGTGGLERDFPSFTPAQLFALVSDIESYPLFVPGCIATRIVERRERRWRVHNIFGFGPIESRFYTIAEFDEPARLDITSQDGPWKSFRIEWRFRPMERGCRVTCRYSVTYRSRVLSAIASLATTEAERLIMNAFETRAHTLYDRRATGDSGPTSPLSPTP